MTVVTKPPAAADEYTPEQRRLIDARLAKPLQEVERGRTHGPFKTHEQMMEFLNRRSP